MRDIFLIVFLFGSVPFILRRPTYGVMLWVWVSVMNPHRLAWGPAYDMPFAMVIAATTVVGAVFSREPKQIPFNGITIVLLLLTIWMSVTTIFALNPDPAVDTWIRVTKTMFMVFVTIYLLHSKKHVYVLVCILAASIAYYGIKGGVFTLVGGGESKVWGPEGSYIEENNALAVATIMTIPLLRYIQMHASNRWLKIGLLGAMILCGFSALGSHSRGALIAILATLLFLWIKGQNKVRGGLVLLLLVPVGIAFMPDSWTQRMQTIETYEQDASAMGRINAWKMAMNLAQDRIVFGGGFQIYEKEIFARYAPVPDDVHAAHSIYFAMLGEHGFIGLGLFLLLWILVWRNASWIDKHARSREDLIWAADLARMIQVSVLGYLVGGGLLSLAYYDVPYYLAAALVVTRALVERELQPATARGRAGSVMPAARAKAMQ